jgi:uncharacterized protein YndB with AHSA1/START domain
MPTIRVRRTLPAPPGRVWTVVGDAHQLPRWWPRAERVERVTPKAFTLVLRSRQGRVVRADNTVIASSRPRRRAWGLEVAGTPYENVFVSNEVDIQLDPAEGDGTRVTIEARQRLKGGARLGGFLVRRSVRRQLSDALDGLEAALPAE